MTARTFGAVILVDPSIVKDGYWYAHGIRALPREGEKTQAIPKVPAL